MSLDDLLMYGRFFVVLAIIGLYWWPLDQPKTRRRHALRLSAFLAVAAAALVGLLVWLKSDLFKPSPPPDDLCLVLETFEDVDAAHAFSERMMTLWLDTARAQSGVEFSSIDRSRRFVSAVFGRVSGDPHDPPPLVSAEHGIYRVNGGSDIWLSVDLRFAGDHDVAEVATALGRQMIAQVEALAAEEPGVDARRLTPDQLHAWRMERLRPRSDQSVRD